MNLLGRIGSPSYELYNRDYQLSLEKEVATVSDSEAQLGATNSDEVILALGKKSQSEKALNLAAHIKRASKAAYLKQQTSSQEKDENSSSCAIDKARANSLVGENAPLNWLVADDMDTNHQEPSFGSQKDLFSKPTLLTASSFSSPERLSTSFVEQPASSESLFVQEWLLSPCA